MVVPDAYRNCEVGGFEQVVVDNRTSLSEVTTDIWKGHLQVRKYGQLILMVGREDMFREALLPVVFEWFRTSLQKELFNGLVIIAGPLPLGMDPAEVCYQLKKVQTLIGQLVMDWDEMRAVDLLSYICDDSGVIPQMLSIRGLS